MLFMVLAMPMSILAQDSAKQKEIGLLFYGLNDFGLTYRVGSDDRLWRFQAIFVNGHIMDSDRGIIKTTDSDWGVEVGIGREYRKSMTENLDFRIGWDLSMNYNYSKSSVETEVMGISEVKEFYYQPEIKMIIGVNYIINEHLIVGAELLPGISYRYGKRTDVNSEGIEVETDFTKVIVGISSNVVLLSLAYKF